MGNLQEAVGKLVQMGKETSSDVGKLRIAINSLKKESVSSMNKLMCQVDSLQKGADSSQNQLVVTV